MGGENAVKLLEEFQDRYMFSSDYRFRYFSLSRVENYF